MLKAKVIKPPPSDVTPRSSAHHPPSTPALPVEKQKAKVEEPEEEEGKKDRYSCGRFLTPFPPFQHLTFV